MATKVIELHEALDGSTFSSLQEAQKHNMGIKKLAFRELVLTINHVIDNEEYAEHLANDLIRDKQSFKILFI